MKKYLLLAVGLFLWHSAHTLESSEVLRNAALLGEWLEYDQALDMLKDLSGDSISQYVKVRFLVINRDYHSAIKEADIFLKTWPESNDRLNCLWQRAYSLKKIGLYRDALFDFMELAKQDTILSDIAWMNAGLCLRQEGNGKAAERIFDSLYTADGQRGGDSLLISIVSAQENPSIASAPNKKSTIYRANRLISRKSYTAAINLLDRFIHYNKNSQQLGQAQYMIGKCLERQGKILAAAQAYLKVPVVQPASTWSDEAYFRAGWCYYKIKSWDRALECWQDVSVKYPRGDFREVAIFWQAKLLQEKGEKAGALQKYRELASEYEYTYYGWRAKEKIRGYDLSDDSLSSEKVAQMAFLDSAVIQQPEEPDSWIKDHRRFTQASRLVDMGLFDEAGSLAEAIRKISWNDAVALHYLARLYSRAGMDPQAIFCAKRAFDLWLGPRPRSLMETLYPRRYLGYIGNSLSKSPMETALVLSVMRQESRFVAGARSRAGARGLMQIMPKTGKRLSGMKKFKPDTLYHPETSIDFGTKFLAGLIKQFDGSIIRSLAAYNAGPQRVKQWLKSERSRNDDDFLIEEIPYLETRNYIKKVMVGYYIYRWLLEEEK